MKIEGLVLRSKKLPRIILSSDLDVSMADNLARIANDYTIYTNIGSHSFPHPYTYTDAVDFIQKNRESGGETFAIDFAMLLDSSLVGIIGISDISIVDRSAHIGYFVGKDYRGNGIASAALSVLTDFSFSELKLHRLHTRVFSDNIPSIRVLRKCGYSQEGMEKDAFFWNGSYRDFLLFSRLSDH